ncbi:MAG: hypothetical protein P8H96_13720 [Akkermansiaceae bacterium]|nr:hypothetical protein [Akkermansiaceae bacterium]
MKAPLTATLLSASIISASQAAIIGFNEDFTGANLDPAWNEGGATGGAFDAANDHYSITNTNGSGGTKLSRTEGGTLGDYTHMVTLGLNSFMGTGADVKWKTFGPDGFTEMVFNSFGNVRQFHPGGNLYNNVPITVADGDTLSFKQVYTLSSNTMDVSYSVNGDLYQPLYSGTGNGASGFQNVITNFAEVEVFEFGAGDPVPTVTIENWSLSPTVAIPEPSTSLLLAGCFALTAIRRRR